MVDSNHPLPRDLLTTPIDFSIEVATSRHHISSMLITSSINFLQDFLFLLYYPTICHKDDGRSSDNIDSTETTIVVEYWEKLCAFCQSIDRISDHYNPFFVSASNHLLIVRCFSAATTVRIESTMSPFRSRTRRIYFNAVLSRPVETSPLTTISPKSSRSSSDVGIQNGS